MTKKNIETKHLGTICNFVGQQDCHELLLAIIQDLINRAQPNQIHANQLNALFRWSGTRQLKCISHPGRTERTRKIGIDFSLAVKEADSLLEAFTIYREEHDVEWR